MSEVTRAISLTAPLLAGLLAHGLSIKYGLLSATAKPIDAGHTFRGRRLFGANKTFRGVLAVGAGTSVGFLLRATVAGAATPEAEAAWLSQPSVGTALFGFLVGAAAMLSELPNSFVKRQLGIQPGEQGKRVLGVVFFVIDQIDQIDLVVGVCLVLSLAVSLSPLFVLYATAVLFVAHQVLTIAGFALGIRATWR